LNGHRIELGEITAAILHHPLVSNAITVMGRSEMNQKYLSAYYVSPDGPDSMNEDLKSYLRTKLPVYMVPQYVVRLETLPLTSSGKIDRKQLPQPLETAVASDFVAPRNEQEEILVEIWQNVLHVERVGIHDNFFELGGASIQAIQVVTKANMFGYSINIEHLFEHQTIAELGEFIQAQADHG
jgi:aryl carrier-like protein